MANPSALVTRKRMFSAPEQKILYTRAPFTGTVVKVKIVVENASASGDAEFEFYINGALKLGGPMVLLESSFEIDSGAISEAITEGQTLEVRLTACPSPIGDDLTIWVEITDP